MKQWGKQFWAITGNTFTVLMGDPLTLIIHVLIIGLTLVIACMPGFSNVGGQLKLVRDQSLALSFMALSLLAAVGVRKALCDDMSKGMMPSIMSRPVSYSALILGKWAGVISSIFLLVTTAAIACLWTTRIIHYRLRIESLGLITYLVIFVVAMLTPALRHYWKGGNYMWQTNLTIAILFPIAFFVLNFFGFEGASGSSFGSLVDWRSALAFAYIFMPLMVFTAILMFFATIMDVSFLMICAALLFFGGLFSAYMVNLLFTSDTLKAAIWIFTPNWQLYWLSDDLASSHILSWAYLLPRLLNAVVQPAIFLILGIASFKRLEIKGSV